MPGPLSSSDPALVERVRAALEGRHPREVAMFGGISFMVDGRLVAAARRTGELLVRVDPADRERLLAEPGAREAVMGTGRVMGAGWITVGPEALTDEALAAWLRRALASDSSQTPR